jgi:hypothetical protein
VLDRIEIQGARATSAPRRLISLATGHHPPGNIRRAG